jgi:hypothetical protein
MKNFKYTLTQKSKIKTYKFKCLIDLFITDIRLIPVLETNNKMYYVKLREVSFYTIYEKEKYIDDEKI